MAKKISASDIFQEEDIFKGIKASAEETIKKFTEIDAALKKTAENLKKDIGGADFGNTKGINNFVTATKKATKAQKDAVAVDKVVGQAKKEVIAADKALIEVEIKKQKLAQETIRTNNTIAKTENDKAKATEKAAKAAVDESNAYKQLSNSTRDLKNESKMLAAEMLHLEQNGRKNSKEYRDLAKTYKTVTVAAKEGDAQLKKIDGTVGDNFRNVGNYTKGVDRLRNGLGQLGLAFGIGSIVKGAGQTIVEFDQKIADLVSITGAGGKDLAFYKQQAIEMGKGVQGGAGAVIEAYKLIGSAKPELLANAKALDAVTQSAITLSQASGMTLPDAATALTDAMNQFGAPAEKAGQFIDALANGALLGSAEIPQVTDALLKFGAVAKSSNVSVEESVALIETLAEKGLKGAEAGTALRNVMLKISAPDALPREAQERLQALGISFEDLKNPATSMADKLALLKPLLKDNAAMVKVFGMENTVSATNLIANTDRVKELTKGMSAQGTASKQAEDRTKTLSFAFNELKESWNALVLSLSSGEGTSAILVDGLSFIAKNLSTIISVVGKAAIAWSAYMVVQKSIQAVNFVTTGGLKTVASGMMDVFKAGKQAGEGAKVAGEGVSKAGKAMTAVPWMAIIAVVVELGLAFYKMASGADDAARAQKGLNDAISDGQKFGDSLNKIIDEDYEKNKRNLDLKKSQGKLTKEQYEQELKFLKEGRLTRIKVEMQWEIEEKEKAKKTLKGLKKYYDAAMETMSVFRSKEQIQVIARFEAAQEELRQSNEVLSKLYAQKKSLNNLAIDEKIQENTDDRAKNSDKLKEQTDKTKDLNKAIEDEIALQELRAEQQYAREVSEKEALDAIDLQIEKDAEARRLEEEIIDEQRQEYDLAQKRAKEESDAADKKAKDEAALLAQQQKNQKTQDDLVKAATDFFIAQSNKKIEQIDKEIAAANTQYTTLQTLAANGNINAKESLAEQQKIINEANAQKAKELKKQQRIKLAESVYSTYNAKVAGGSEHPLLDTIKDTMLLQQFIASLPTFHDGTEDTGKNGNGIDGKGGFHAILHPNERVVPKSLNEQIGGLSNEALAKMANEYQNGKIIRSNSQIGSSFDTAILVGKIDELTNAIKMKPETNIGIGEITQSVMEIVKSTKQGNTTTYNRYKVRR
jgi:TP901 family phage tail tape measure protein